MSGSEWTPEQAAELLAEQILALLDGVDDDDTVRVELVWAAIAEVWGANFEGDPSLPEGMTAGQVRRKMLEWRRALAEVETLRLDS